MQHMSQQLMKVGSGESSTFTVQIVMNEFKNVDNAIIKETIDGILQVLKGFYVESLVGSNKEGTTEFDTIFRLMDNRRSAHILVSGMCVRRGVMENIPIGGISFLSMPLNQTIAILFGVVSRQNYDNRFGEQAWEATFRCHGLLKKLLSMAKFVHRTIQCETDVAWLDLHSYVLLPKENEEKWICPFDKIGFAKWKRIDYLLDESHSAVVNCEEIKNAYDMWTKTGELNWYFVRFDDVDLSMKKAEIYTLSLYIMHCQTLMKTISQIY